ncbi:hypothetical protein QHF83_50550 [Polyangium sp. 15x6]|nr:hypothetical protein [Polyangium sp. 15x6]
MRTPRFVWVVGVALIAACMLAAVAIVMLSEKNERLKSSSRFSESRLLELENTRDEQSKQLSEAKTKIADLEKKLAALEDQKKSLEGQLAASRAGAPVRTVGNITATWSEDRERVAWKVLVSNPSTSPANVRAQYYCFGGPNDLQYPFDGVEEPVPPGETKEIEDSVALRSECTRKIFVIILWHSKALSRVPVAIYVW